MTAGSSGGQKPSVADAMDSRYTPKNTSMTFRINNFAQSAGKGRTIVKTLVGKKLMWFVTMVRSNITGMPDAENIWYDVLGEQMYNGVVIRFYIDYPKLLSHNIILSEIASTCFGDFVWHVSPDFMGMIDVDVPDRYISKILSQMGTLVCGTPEITSCNIDDSSLPGHSSLKPMLRSGAKHLELRSGNGRLQASDAPLGTALTRGSNILSVSRAHGVDRKTIISNHVADVERSLGIEAATRALRDIIGSDIISDFMTRTGKVLPFFKYSIEVPKKGILTSTGFERPKNDIRAAIRSNAWDTHVSIYADIMTGTDPMPGFDVIIN
jgi:hypothetical protein